MKGIRRIKNFFQRARKGYSDVDLLIYDKYLALLIINSMTDFLKIAQLSEIERKKGEELVRRMKGYFYEKAVTDDFQISNLNAAFDILKELYQNWWN